MSRHRRAVLTDAALDFLVQVANGNALARQRRRERERQRAVRRRRTDETR
ncbi:hypothetical protein [Halomonas sp. BM-2019]|nr:MAG: hypothetical protein J5F18_04825 [Halomonas sp. BM-2019]